MLEIPYLHFRKKVYNDLEKFGKEAAPLKYFRGKDHERL